MPSFNFDIIFNAVYTFFLAIRYVFLFWILGIDKNLYLEDHKVDFWDGLRDLGWIKPTENNLFNDKNVIYLGDIQNKDVINLNIETKNNELSWFDILKERLFGIKSHHIYSNSDTNFGINPQNINYTIDNTNQLPWFFNLKFSIQNSILSFFSDILSVLSLFTILILIFAIIKWFYIITAPIFEKKQKIKEELLKKEIEENQKYIDPSIFNEKKNTENIKIENAENILNKEETIKEHFDSKEENIEEKSDFNTLLNYKTKNSLTKKENTIVKIDHNNSIKDILKRKIEENNQKEETFLDNKKDKFESRSINNQIILDKSKANTLGEEEQKNWFLARWNIILGYFEGDEEALWRIAILEADALLDEILKSRGYEGNNLGERLKNSKFNTIDLAWSAHKMRNRIAHEGIKLVLTERMIRQTKEAFKAVFKEFNIITE